MGREDVVIVGAGGHGLELLEIAHALERADPAGAPRVRGLLDDRTPDAGLLERLGTAYLGSLEDAGALGLRYLVGIGDPDVRRRIDERLRAAGLEPAPPLVHPRAEVGAEVALGPGCVLFAFASVTTEVRLGAHVHVSVHASVAHHGEVGDFVSVYPGARLSGNVRVGTGVTVGTQAAVLQNLTLGDRCTVAAGATVVRDVAPGETVAGTPARPLP